VTQLAAVGIHSHPTSKLGKRPPTAKPAIRYTAIRTATAVTAPTVPATFDDLSTVTFGLDGNDQYGVCVPTGFDNFRRLVTKLYSGAQVDASQDQIFTWYREQNPNFDPATGAGDNGMDIQTFLSARVKAGDILAFASVDKDSDTQVREATWLFGGLILGVDLQIAQQTQPTWDYSQSPQWGGHCVMQGATEATADGSELEDCISWATRVQMTQAFLAHQRSEAWVVVTSAHLANPTFRQGIDLRALAEQYTALTGRPFPGSPVPPSPSPSPAPVPVVPPSPSPTPVVDPDQELADTVRTWLAERHHWGEASHVAHALQAWESAKGLS
jgi:hypothetical protein